jgi:hypothetical protein
MNLKPNKWLIYHREYIIKKNINFNKSFVFKDYHWGNVCRYNSRLRVQIQEYE